MCFEAVNIGKYFKGLSDFLEGDLRKDEMKRRKMRRRRGALKLDIKINYYSIIGITRC